MISRAPGSSWMPAFSLTTIASKPQAGARSYNGCAHWKNLSAVLLILMHSPNVSGKNARLLAPTYLFADFSPVPLVARGPDRLK